MSSTLTGRTGAPGGGHQADAFVANPYVPEVSHARTASGDNLDPSFDTFVSQPLRASRGEDGTGRAVIAHTLKGEGSDGSEDGTGRGTPIIPIQDGRARDNKDQNGFGVGEEGGPAYTIDTTGGGSVAYGLRSDAGRSGEARTPSADAEGKVRLRDPGFNVLEEQAPTLDAGAPHSVAYRKAQKAHDPDDCERWEEDDVTDTLTGHATTSAEAIVVRATGDYADPSVKIDDKAFLSANPMSDRVDAVAFTERSRAQGRTLESQEELAYALTNPGSGGRTHSRQLMDPQMSVRRLTPTECERLQGFPDGWTAGLSDSARYRALGNAVCVPVAAWIARRIVSVDGQQEP